MQINAIKYKDSKSAQSRPEFYAAVTLNVKAVIQSWQLSVFSFEWLNQDGSIKSIEELKESDRERRQLIEAALQSGEPLDKPVLGIGIQDNVEIGSGKAILCTLAAHGVETIPAHIPKSNESDFKPMLADI